VELIKNGRILRRFFPDEMESPSPGRYRLRITWGWGRKREPVRWDAKLSLSDGEIADVETCFSGQPVVAPKTQVGDEQIPDDDDLPHELVERGERHCVWRSVTTGNPTMRHPTTQAISLGIDAPSNAAVTVEVNGHRYEHSLAELLRGGRSHYLRGWLTEAIVIGPAVPISACRVEGNVTDDPERDVDRYRLQVAQKNGHWAWLTPIWASR
jgi:hypothetical protein